MTACSDVEQSNAAGSRRQFALALVALLLLGLLIRVPLLQRLGHGYDQDAYRVWMGAIQDHGLAKVFERTNTDYVGYHYVLWALGKAYRGQASQVTVRDKELRLWLKVPGLVGDLLSTVLVAAAVRTLARERGRSLARRWGPAGRRLGLDAPSAAGLAAGAVVFFNPVLLYAEAYWGQQDSLIAFFMLTAVWLAARSRPGWAGAALAVGTIVKPQPLVLVPLLAWLVWRRGGWRPLVRAAVAGTAVLLVGHVYFIVTGNGERVLDIYLFQLRQNEHLSFGAYNLWWPAEHLADARPETAILSAGGLSLTYGLVASALVVVALALSLVAMRAGEPLDALTAAGFFLAAYFLVAAAVHERYALPALVLLLAALPFRPGLRWPLLLLTASVFINLLVGNPLDRRWSVGEPVWLTLVASACATLSVLWLGAFVLRGGGGGGEPAPELGPGLVGALSAESGNSG